MVVGTDRPFTVQPNRQGEQRQYWREDHDGDRGNEEVETSLVGNLPGLQRGFADRDDRIGADGAELIIAIG